MDQFFSLCAQHPHPIIILKDVRYQDLKSIIRFVTVKILEENQNDFLPVTLLSAKLGNAAKKFPS
jgi:hypothetical protein